MVSLVKSKIQPLATVLSLPDDRKPQTKTESIRQSVNNKIIVFVLEG